MTGVRGSYVNDSLRVVQFPQRSPFLLTRPMFNSNAVLFGSCSARLPVRVYWHDMGMLASPATAQGDNIGDTECTSVTVVDADGNRRYGIMQYTTTWDEL